MPTKTTEKFTVLRVSADLSADEITEALATHDLIDEEGRFKVEGEAVADLGSQTVEFWFPA